MFMGIDMRQNIVFFGALYLYEHKEEGYLLSVLGQITQFLLATKSPPHCIVC